MSLPRSQLRFKAGNMSEQRAWWTFVERWSEVFPEGQTVRKMQLDLPRLSSALCSIFILEKHWEEKKKKIRSGSVIVHFMLFMFAALLHATCYVAGMLCGGQHGMCPVITDEAIRLGSFDFHVFPLIGKVNKAAAGDCCTSRPWLAAQYDLAVATIRLAKWAKLARD